MDVNETLQAFAAKKCSEDDVMRALALHPGYFLPATYAHSIGIDRAARAVVFSEQGGPPPGELWLFTDLEHARAASAKGPLGTYLGPLDGVTVLRGIDLRTEKVKINPVTELSSFWFIGQQAIPLAQWWANAASVEKAIALCDEPGGPLRMVEAMRAYDGWQVFAHPDDSIVTASDFAGMNNPALVFTAPDCAEEGLVALGRPDVRRLTLASKRLFTMLPQAGVDGFIVNICGPGAQLVAPLGLCDAIVSA